MPIYKGQTKIVKLYKGTTQIVKRYKGTDLIYSASRLPSAFQEVEYIESSGTQYIDTNLVATTTMEFELKMWQSSNAKSKIFGSRENATTKSFSLYFSTGNALTFNFYGNVTAESQNYDNMVLTLKGLISGNNFNCFINESLVRSISIQSVSLYSGNMYLIAYNNGGNASLPNTTGQFRMYYCQIYDNNTLVRNFVPCYRKADNEIGLYDLVNGVFYTNAGTGTFTKGPDV